VGWLAAVKADPTDQQNSKGSRSRHSYSSSRVQTDQIGNLFKFLIRETGTIDLSETAAPRMPQVPS
jgi:hypothetical protein